MGAGTNPAAASVSAVVRRVSVLVLTVALAGCGSGVQGSGVPGSSVEGSATAEGSGTAERSESVPEPVKGPSLQPPQILLVSGVGTQKAVLGSYCLQYEDEATGQSKGVCADSAPALPNAVTSVVGGDQVTFVVRDSTLKDGSAVTIRPLGCRDRVTSEIKLEPGAGPHEWKVDLDYGAYQLDVFALFDAEDGRSGDVSGTLGLTVAGPKTWDALGVGPVRRIMQVCPFAD
jgi:hypothetical protein